ncbi:thioesterase family protein [Ferruginibacter sp.]
MATFIAKAAIRWADIDPNFHVLHSKYYDYCANARMDILSQYGITMQVVQEEHIGPRQQWLLLMEYGWILLNEN